MGCMVDENGDFEKVDENGLWGSSCVMVSVNCIKR